MKYRYGFVSNSSSTSFCVYGIWVEKAVALKYLLDNGLADQAEVDKIRQNFNDDDENYDLDQYLQEQLDKLKLDIYCDYDSMHCIVGQDVEGLVCDEKGRKILCETQKKLAQFFPVPEFTPAFHGGEVSG